MTIKDIAAEAGVSRGTVDRVLHNRKDVSIETARKVKAIAEKTGYVPNKAGKILAARKQQIRLGCLLPDTVNSFFNDVIKGFKKAESELSDYGISVEIQKVKNFDQSAHISGIRNIAKEKYDGICLTTLDIPEVQREVYAITQQGIPVVSVNTDIPDSGRICYVGPDYERDGKTAAGMLSLTVHEKLHILVVSGSFKIRGHNDRIHGFQSGLIEHRVNAAIEKTVEALDDLEHAYQLTKQILAERSDINCIFVAAGGVSGVCRAVHEAKTKNIHLIVFDELPEIKHAIKNGSIQFTICQEPEVQGYQGIMKLFSWLMASGKKDAKDYVTQTIIKIADNMDC